MERKPIKKLEEIFSKFPGIGPRQAKRFVYYLMTRNKSQISDLSKLILEIGNNTSVCPDCLRFFEKERNNNCDICSNTHRDHELLMVVARDIDFENIEKSKTYKGLYFILGGTLPILDENPEAKIRITQLIKKIEKDSSKIKEIILAMSSNPDGENTLEYLLNTLKPTAEKLGIKISSLGKGISTGTEIEYSDEDTLKNALSSRK